MRTVLGRSAGRASFIFALAGMVGSVALPAVPAAAGAAHHRASVHQHRHASDVEIGTAVKYVRTPNGKVHRVR
jgi:hypothetical protein